MKNAKKTQTILKKHGGYPGFYLQSITQLEDALTKVYEDKEAKKKMNAPNAKALVAMKQKLRKYVSSLDAEIEKWKAVSLSCFVYINIRIRRMVSKMKLQINKKLAVVQSF
jgi:hypothetical protein